MLDPELLMLQVGLARKNWSLFMQLTRWNNLMLNKQNIWNWKTTSWSGLCTMSNTNHTNLLLVSIFAQIPVYRTYVCVCVCFQKVEPFVSTIAFCCKSSHKKLHASSFGHIFKHHVGFHVHIIHAIYVYVCFLRSQNNTLFTFQVENSTHDEHDECLVARHIDCQLRTYYVSAKRNNPKTRTSFFFLPFTKSTTFWLVNCTTFAFSSCVL